MARRANTVFRTGRRWASALALLTTTSCTGDRVASPETRGCVVVSQALPRPVVVRGANVFDGDVLLTGQSVVIAGESIAAVSSCADASRVPHDEVDGRGATLLPGLIDAHVHIGDSDDAFRRALAFGVTTVFDMFGPPERIVTMRARDRRGEATHMVDLYGAGILATAPGGHGTEYGFPIPTLATPAEAKAFVDARLQEGSDFLKVVIDTAPPPMPTLDGATVAALVAEAHAHQRFVVAHVGTERDAEEAVGAGVDGLAHAFTDEPPRDKLVEAIVRQRVFVVATLSMMEQHCGLATGKPLLSDPQFGPRLTDAEKRSLSKSRNVPAPAGGSSAACLGHAFALLRALRGRAPILAGTDADNGGTIFGASLHRELELLVEAGLTPREALVAATSAPARAFRLEDRGRVSPGLRADLLLVNGDPLRDILATRAIRAVWRRGVVEQR